MAALAALTAARVASILHEPGLTRPDEDNATLALLLPEALLAVQGVIRARGYDPADVTNGEDFDHVQAYWAGWRYFAGMQGEESESKAARYREDWIRWEEARAVTPRPVTGSGDAQARGGRRMPGVLNHDSEPVFARGSDTRRLPAPRTYEQDLT